MFSNRPISVLLFITFLCNGHVLGHNSNKAYHSDPNAGQEHFLEHQDIGHIKQDIKDQYHVEVDEKMSEEDIDFYNFKMHDYDQNLLLDGLELLIAFQHDHEANSKDHAETNQAQVNWNEKFEKDSLIIDTVLKAYDLNDDGLISFEEYKYQLEKNKHH
ncbi:hypothetical protein BLOT_011646 [Blomia tropicalis]|nr:hypothetical protein BLOT_011646 [Blomia tropicalis]